MLNRRFLVSWLFCAIVMFSASYLWHGVILNDYDRLNYPKSFYLTIAAAVYLLIGGIVTHVFSLGLFNKITHSNTAKGLITGAICGITIYLVAIVVGITFSSTLTLKYMLVDITWQMIEQSIGGFIVGYVYMIAQHHPWFAMVEDQ